MKKFFLFETELPENSGFDLFGTCHVLWLVGIALCTVVSAVWLRRQTEEKQKRSIRLVGTLLPVMGIYRDVVLSVTGHYDQGFWPLHLCSMALWIGLLYVWTEWRFPGVVYILVCMPGAAGALLFPNWNSYPFWNYMHIHAFLSHGLTIVLGVWLLASGRLVPRWRDFWMPVLFGLAGFVLIYRWNLWQHTNFWFLNVPSHGSPLVWIYGMTGSGWYLVGYYGFCILIVAVWQGIISWCVRRKK